MKKRCTSTNCHAWKDYGGRGITFDPAWEKFENFLADMGEAPHELTLDRIDNDGNYTKENCRWATRKEQNRNSRKNLLISFTGQVKPLSVWCESLGLSYIRVYKRLARGWTPEEAFS